MHGRSFFCGLVIWQLKDAKPDFLKFVILWFLFFFFQSSVLSLGKSLGYNLQLAISIQISISIFLAWFTCLQNGNTPSAAGKPRYYIDIVSELLHGDRDAAMRLFNYNKDKFGGKSDDWLWQKVIRDIERDRR